MEAKKGALDEQLMEYINEWRKQRSKEEEELQRLKEKQSKRKEVRAEQEKKLAQQKVKLQSRTKAFVYSLFLGVKLPFSRGHNTR